MKRTAAVWLIAVAVWAPQAAHAQFSLRADWAERPSSDQLSSEYPAIPMRLRLEGLVMLRCQVRATGAAEDCYVESEDPKDLGFGAAALKMARNFQMRPAVSLGAARHSERVRIPVRFKLPPDDAQEPPPVTISPTQAALVRRLVARVDLMAAPAKFYEDTALELESGTVHGAPETVGAAAADALRKSVAALLPEERLAVGARIASRMSEPDLAEVVRFAETREGRAYLGYFPTTDPRAKEVDARTRARHVAAAREAFCKGGRCDTGTALTAPDGDDPDAPLVVTEWGQAPSEYEQLRAWPLSWMIGVSGYAQLVCRIDLRGAPDECQVAAETPGGVGVAEAVRELAARYRVPSAELAAYAGRKVAVLQYFNGSPAEPTPPGATVGPRRMSLATELVRLQSATWPDLHPEVEVAKYLETYPIHDETLRAEVAAALLVAFEAGQAGAREGLVWLLATTLDETTLQAAITFENGAGAAFRRACAETEGDLAEQGKAFDQRVSVGARTAFCATRACTPSGSGAPGGR